MDKTEWLTRCAREYATRGGLDAAQAREAAEVALQADVDGDFAEAPEEAAREDMLCWTDDGED